MNALPFILHRWMRRPHTLLAACGLALVGAAWFGLTNVQALPEYTNRTGEACAACHVSAGGGGPRTLRGLLWAARGRPDKLPVLPGLLVAPGVSGGPELYEIACSGCHGLQGEGLYGNGLVGLGISRGAMRGFITRGIPALNMPRFEGQFTPAQLDTLVAYAASLSSGQVAPPPAAFPLPQPRFKCASRSDFGCGNPPAAAQTEGN